MRHGLALIATSSLWAAVACSDGGTGVTLPPCASSFGSHIGSALGSDTMLDPASDSGCVVFANNPSGIDSAIYLVVPQSATGVPGITASFSLHGDTVRPALAAAGAPYTPALTLAQRFHDFLRQSEQRRWFGSAPAGPGRAAVAPFPAAPDTVGQQRGFSVCSTLTCSVFTRITATAKAVQSTLVIYVDNAAPAGGLSTADLDTLAQTFDSRLYAVDTSAFGRESDVDGNGKVIVLMTPLVNKLVTKTQCNDPGGGFVAGFFFGADIDPVFATDSRFNHAEVFYSLVADPDSVLSCAHAVSEVKHVVPVTFIHEFQHMISYNQHVLIKGGDPEVLWLNEGFSHYAEELGGRSYLPTDSVTFTRFVKGDLYNAYQYLDSTGNHFLLPTAGIGSLAERGAAWLFVRYLVDQQRADTSFAAGAAVTRPMEATTLTGATNVANATGVPFDRTVTNWALANYVSDLPGFTAPSRLKYSSWAFRAAFASLHTQYPTNFIKTFPLTPGVSAGSATNASGTLRAGSGEYRLVTQLASGPGFTLRFGTSSGGPLAAAVVARLTVIKIK
ncbi:MAG TPA: hypothetical protein VEO93_04300 [Gemmatimonadales bacterium]|nr:hypothetical protein [Gemmatimonadales bacterium]